MNTEQEPQAQAEPEVVAYRNPTDLYSIIGKYEKENNTFQYTDEFLEAHNEELIPLQFHREIVAALEEDAAIKDRLNQNLCEAIAKKDAALDACVEAGKRAIAALSESIMIAPLDKLPPSAGAAMQDLDAAITQAKEARK